MQPYISFAILHTRRLKCTQACIQAIRETVHIPHEIVLVVQGRQSEQATKYLRGLEDRENVTVGWLRRNIGSVGRNLTVDLATGKWVMTLDNDCYLQPNWFGPVHKIMQNPKVLTINIPLYNQQGELSSMGGVLKTENGVIRDVAPNITTLDYKRGYVEVDTQPEGAMIFRKLHQHVVQRDTSYWLGLGGLDMNLTVNRYAKRNGFVRVASLHSKARHYSIQQDECYKRIRQNYKEIIYSYRRFQRKWGLHLPVRRHLMYVSVFPLLSHIPEHLLNAIRHVRRQPILRTIVKPKQP